jgi:hypothetical protein
VGREPVKEGGGRHLLLSFARWFDSWAGAEEIVAVAEKRLDGFRVVPFLVMHLACLGILAVGWSPVAVWTAAALYLARMFAVTGIYHRYAVSARQGFYWWEVDVTYYILWVLALVGIVRDLEPVPEAVLAEGRRIDAAKGHR